MIVTDNSPSAGYIAWEDVVIDYKGTEYNIANDNSNMTYIWWDFTSPNELQKSNTLPDLEDDDCVVFYNDNGTHYIAPIMTILEGGLLRPGTVDGSTALKNASVINIKFGVTSTKITNLNADYVDGKHIFVQSDEPAAESDGDLWFDI